MAIIRSVLCCPVTICKDEYGSSKQSTCLCAQHPVSIEEALPSLKRTAFLLLLYLSERRVEACVSSELCHVFPTEPKSGMLIGAQENPDLTVCHTGKKELM